MFYPKTILQGTALVTQGMSQSTLIQNNLNKIVVLTNKSVQMNRLLGG